MGGEVWVADKIAGRIMGIREFCIYLQSIGIILCYKI